MKRVLTFAVSAVVLCGIWILSDSESVKAFVQNVDLTSPRLSALKKELEASNRAALESFWVDITKQGAPLCWCCLEKARWPRTRASRSDDNLN